MQIASIVVIMFFISLICLIFGMYKPWVVLWWRDVQNRRGVIGLYGTIALITFLFYQILRNLEI